MAIPLATAISFAVRGVLDAIRYYTRLSAELKWVEGGWRIVIEPAKHVLCFDGEGPESTLIPSRKQRETYRVGSR